MRAPRGRRVGSTHSGGWGTGKMTSFPRMARVFGAPRGRRVETEPELPSNTTDMGQVLLNGVLIPKSNISDLISDAMRSRKHFNPVGVREFYNVLNEINIPKDLVRNERRWTEKNSLNEKSPPGKPQEERTISNWLTL